MAPTERHGNALLNLTTKRPPDSSRGVGIVHLELTLPQIIADQIALWETGARGPVDPLEAATLLWSQPVAQYLNGQIDAWLTVPGVRWLLPGLDTLITSDSGTWPDNQAKLRNLIAGKAPGSPSWESLFETLKKDNTIELLNDLVLIFKFAAVGRRRPLRKVVELYRLIRALTTSTDVPASHNALIAYLRAPLVVPQVLTSAPGPAGPRPPSPDEPTMPDPTSGGVLPERILERLKSELSQIELEKGTKTRAVGGIANRSSSSAVNAERLQPRVIRTRLYGTEVLIDIAKSKTRIDLQRKELARRIARMLPAKLRQELETYEQAGIDIENLTTWRDLLQAIMVSPSYLKPVGCSDLLLVRQTTTGYRRTEIAYIENILIGETRNRDHTKRVLSRQEFFESVTRESEETRDLQTTDRAELSREVSKVVSEDLKAQGSVEVTSRGPTTVVASVSGSVETSTEQAAQSAEEYSRETIERAVKRTMERITRETRSLFEQETIEVNHHGFARESNAQDHVSGVYQYLERVSRARIFWYGERELYDILIPEPASLIWHLAISRREMHLPIEHPDEELFRSITVDNIESKREEIIRAFRVTDMPSVPENPRQTGTSFAATGSTGAKYASSKELQIPEGYVVTSAKFVASAEIEEGDDEPNGGISVAGEIYTFLMSLSDQHTGKDDHEFNFEPALPGPTIPIAIHVDNFTSFFASVELTLQLTDAAYEAWALEAFGRVSERYEQLRREYEQALIQATANQSTDAVDLPEGARSQLNQIVRAELQRASIEVMRNMPVNFDLITDFGVANEDGTLGLSQPVIDIDALRRWYPEIQFLQQAFEWEHLAWILYPYFWGRRGEWSRTVIVSHPDPDFAAFLNAGAARVQIPVRPGFEELVRHFMETREVYEGDGLPKMGDPGYLPFIDEQMTSLGAPGEEVPWPPDNPREWDIVAPTSLILVRPAKSKLPTWDPYTGEETSEETKKPK